ncbi:hypothetical protein HK407_06g10660 [Ordospora pajunii]|uniref:uncharacterized protein n=1 Tax=Ordospora pajunii TaxID=3039483 RepID=UPI0029529058|nr:uncharacterized protein HK407_06g10660 [Ordospora pajunii]KAH9411237.1 hypothetical protein HK407_06g10660 [Ordospora pajunii]
MQIEYNVFSYRNDDKIACAGFCTGRIFASLPHKIVEWSRTERAVACVHEISEEVVGMASMSDGCIALLSKSSVWLLLGSEIRYVMEKPPLCGVVVYRERLLLIDEQSITSMCVQERSTKISRAKMRNRSGMCTCGAESENGLLLAFENGDVVEISAQAMADILDGRAAEVDTECLRTMIRLREPVISVGVLNHLLVVALFNRKMLTINLKSGEVSYTELAYEVKFSALWNGMIVVSDSRENIILMDEHLKIAYSKRMRDEVCSLVSSGTDLIVGFSTGTVKECRLSRFDCTSIPADTGIQRISANAGIQAEADGCLRMLCSAIKYL